MTVDDDDDSLVLLRLRGSLGASFGLLRSLDSPRIFSLVVTTGLISKKIYIYQIINKFFFRMANDISRTTIIYFWLIKDTSAFGATFGAYVEE